MSALKLIKYWVKKQQQQKRYIVQPYPGPDWASPAVAPSVSALEGLMTGGHSETGSYIIDQDKQNIIEATNSVF